MLALTVLRLKNSSEEAVNKEAYGKEAGSKENRK